MGRMDGSVTVTGSRAGNSGTKFRLHQTPDSDGKQRPYQGQRVSLDRG